MKSRRRSRESTLQVLYQCDTLENWGSEQVNLYFEYLYDGKPDTLSGQEKENHDFALSLIDGVIEHRDFIDSQLTSSSLHWSVNRMSRVDRNILRLATYEICFRSEIPVSVTINEAIEISKRFGADDSRVFVNGVLDNVASVMNNTPGIVDEYLANRSVSKAANT